MPTKVLPGDRVVCRGEERVVVDVVTDDLGTLAILRYPDGDPRREVDAEGGDIHLTAEPPEALRVVDRV